jgi:Flp pilus assembly pilin Flp
MAFASSSTAWAILSTASSTALNSSSSATAPTPSTTPINLKRPKAVSCGTVMRGLAPSRPAGSLCPFWPALNDQSAFGASWRQLGGVVTIQSESGQSMVEYAFILVLIALVVVVMLVTTGGQVRNLFSDITYTLNNQAGL